MKRSTPSEKPETGRRSAHPAEEAGDKSRKSASRTLRGSASVTADLSCLRGRFLVFDGMDGAGKGAQIRRLTEALTAAKIPSVTTRDPGGTTIGDRIRHVLLDYDLSEMDVNCEAFLFMASRAQLVRDVIRPAIKAGKAVVCDRFVSSTCAYQGAAGYDPRRVVELARFAIDDAWPDLTLIIDVPPHAALSRTKRKTASERNREQKEAGVSGHPSLFHDVHPDAMEARPLSFHRRVHKLFAELPDYYPAPVQIVEGGGTIDDVHSRVIQAIVDAFC